MEINTETGQTNQVKIKKDESFQETDSFDEPKGDPIVEEPFFKTAAGTKIDVKQESIDKSRKLLNNQNDSNSIRNSKNFSSPLLKNPQINGVSKAFVSPFRSGDGPSTSSLPPGKRPLTKPESYEKNGGPPPKKSIIEPPKVEKRTSSSSSKHKKERKEIHADVLRVARIHEKDQINVILQESSSSPLILGKISYRRGKDIKYGDRLYVKAEILKKDTEGFPVEIYLEEVLKRKKDGASRDIRRHSIAKAPFCSPPKFIHEIQGSDVKKAVLQINILDLKIELYRGCSGCKYVWKDEKARKCAKCKHTRASIENMVFSRMRVSDFSGQMFINISTKTMEKFLEMLGYKGVHEWIQFLSPNERQNYVFRPMMIEVEKNKNQEWECSDVADVEWTDYRKYLEKKSQKC